LSSISNGKQNNKKPLNDVASARIGKYRPLVKIWLRKNRGSKVSHLVLRGMKRELKPLAGKRYAHLVKP
jgi:hypothetical protein